MKNTSLHTLKVLIIFPFLITLNANAMKNFITKIEVLNKEPNKIYNFMFELDKQKYIAWHPTEHKDFKVIKQNYFVGIKTPWTLESEEVWKLTHILAGKLWILGGLLVVIFSLVLPENINFYIFISITALITIVPIVYSYLKFNELKK